MHTLLCVCPPRVESLFPPVLSKSCNQIPLAFKVWFSKNSSSPCQTPRLGSLMWGSEPSLQWMDFCGIIVLQFVSHPPSGYGIWFYCDCAPPTISLQLLLYLWMWDIFSGEFQCLSVDGCSAVSCDSGTLARVSEYPLLFTEPHYVFIFDSITDSCYLVSNRASNMPYKIFLISSGRTDHIAFTQLLPLTLFSFHVIFGYSPFLTYYLCKYSCCCINR